MKQSIGIILVQLINVLFSFYITLFVASSVEPAQYSLFALYQVITTFMAAFSFMGHETYISRNLLYWKEKGCHKKIKNNISKAIFSRFLIWFVLAIPVSFYIYIITKGEYNERETLTVYSFLFAGMFTSLIQSSTLILKSLNKYLESIIISVIGMLLVKLIALQIFNKYGFTEYLVALMIGTFLVASFATLRLRNYISVYSFKLKGLLVFKKRRDFILSAYMQYLTTYADRLLLSIFFSPELLGTYNLAKQIQEMGKLFIEGFFDPLTQKLVTYRGKKDELFFQLKSLLQIHYIMIIFGLVGVVILAGYYKDIIHILSLNKYPHFDNYFLFALLASVVYLIYKVQINVNALFLAPKLLVKYNAAVLFLSVLTVLLFSVYGPKEYIYGNRLVIEVILSIFNYYLFKGIVR